MKFLLSLILIIKLHLHSAQPVPTQTYANHLVLAQPDAYHLFWNYNDTDIVFEVHVKQTGVNWIGFGLSKNGGMQNSVKYYLIFTLVTQMKSQYITEIKIGNPHLKTWYHIPLYKL
jgi:hypothetical protein